MDVLRIGRKNFLFTAPKQEQSLHLQRIKKYSTECGCNLEAIFTVSGMLMALIWIIEFHDLSLVTLLSLLVITFISGLLGKLTGISIARIKLYHLCKTLKRDGYLLPISNDKGEGNYVNLYQVGQSGSTYV